MKKTLLMLSLAVSAFVAPVATSAAVNSELVGKAMTIGEAVTEITPGNWYLLNNVGRSNYVREETTEYKMRALPTSTLASENAGYLFKITNSTTEGKYNIQSGNGLYFELGNNNSSVSQTARDFDIQKIGSAADRFYMQDVASQYVADGQDTGDYFVGWGQAIPTNTGGNSAYRFISVTFEDVTDVTYTFTTTNGSTFTKTVTIADGEDARDYIPAVDFFTSTGLQEATTTVGENATTFTVTGTWNFPVSDNTVYRLALRPADNPGKVVSVNEAGTDITTNVATTTTLAKTALWYLDNAGYDESGRPILTLHSLMDDTKGVNMTYKTNAEGVTDTNGDEATATLTENPIQFVLITCTNDDKQANDFCLKALDFGDSNCFVNERNHKFSTWNYAGAHSDIGSVIRAFSLTNDDFAALRLAATEDEVNAAKANPTPDAISALINKLEANPLAHAKALLAQAIATAEAFDGTIGTDLGQYNNADDNFADNLTAAKALLNNPDATEDQITAATSAIDVNTLSLNMPKAGRFYRFHYGDKYLTSKVNSEQRFIIEQQSDPDNTSVFYYDAYTENGTNKSHLVTYPGGLVMGNLQSGGRANNGTYKGVERSSAYAGQTITFSASPSERGKYRMVIDGRHVYHMDAQVDAANGTGDAAGYQWEIKEVAWLPIPVDVNKKHFSVCVPVDLNITADRAEPHTGVIQGSNFGLQAIEGTTLPANTPAVLEYKDGAVNNCVYFEITGYPEVAAAAETTSDLTNTGVYATSTKDAEQSYFTVDHESFVPHTDANLPAFAAILKVPTDQAKESYTIAEYNPEYVSITEIEGAANNGKQVIYDLQGRRVQRASKGLYIINGVKTLVK